MNLKNNYHTHTARCGHAIGTDEEYVLNAIKIGIKELGFSDHIPFPDISQPGVRMEYDQLDEYINSIYALKEKYKDKINILCGFEAEYYPSKKEYYEYLLTKVDYLICGQHFNLADDNYLYIVNLKNDKDAVIQYVDNVIAAMQSGLVSYIAHPDIVMRSYTYRDEFLDSQIRRICDASIKYHIPLEINLEGMNRKVMMNDPLGEKFYPFPSFWKIVSEYPEIDVIIGADVHDPNDLLRDYDKYAREIVDMYNLHLIDKIDISSHNE